MAVRSGYDDGRVLWMYGIDAGVADGNLKRIRLIWSEQILRRIRESKA